MLKSAQQWSGLIVCKDSTGALSAPTVGPAGALYVNGTLNAAGVTITGANPYKWTVTLPALSAGDCVSMYITATIAGIATSAIVCEDTADTKRISDLNDIAATAVVSGGAIATAGGAVSTVTNLTNDSPGVTTLLGRIPAALFAGITSLGHWLRLMARKDLAIAADAAAELAEINANAGSGAGGFVSTTDSEEAIRDQVNTLVPGAATVLNAEITEIHVNP